MKLTFIGVGSAFSRQGNSSLLVTSKDNRNILIDCGRTTPDNLEDMHIKWSDIHATYITHTHGDHCYGLEHFAFMRKFGFPNLPKPKLFAHPKVINVLWNNILSGSLGFHPSDPENIHSLSLDAYFYWMHIDQFFSFSGIDFELVKNTHIMPSYGLIFGERNGPKVYFSGDSTIGHSCHRNDLNIIFHDCETLDSPSGVHAHYNQLKALPEDIKKKTWLYHYQSEPLNAIQDDFAGFATKGQVFNV